MDSLTKMARSFENWGRKARKMLARWKYRLAVLNFDMSTQAPLDLF